MASQQAIQRLRSDDPSQVRVAAHDMRVYLLRLVLIAALTGVVVAVWASEDEASLVGSGLSSAATSPVEQTSATITAPAGEQRGAVTPPTLVEERAVTPQPNVIPRPPERPEPERPTEFIRFTVAPADTVFDISVVYGVSIAEILRYNPNLGDGSQVDVGQLIFVPVFESAEGTEGAADDE